MKKGLWVVLIAVAMLIGWRLYRVIITNRAAGGQQRRMTMAVPVEVAPIGQRTMRDVGQFSGSLKPKSGYTVAPKVSGRLRELKVDLGDRVVNGQLLAILDSDIYEQQLEQAKASYAVAAAQVEQTRLAYKSAEANWEGVKRLFDQNFTSQAVMDKTDTEKAAAQARYETTLAEVQRAQAGLRTAEIQLSYTQIRADWTGEGKSRVVGEKFVEEGGMLTANAPILTLVDYSTVTAEIDVIERDYRRVEVGQPVLIDADAYPDHTFEGYLTRLAPVLQQASRQARAEIDIPNADGMLKPGMFVRVRIIYSEKENATVVPSAAIVQREGIAGIFIADASENKARFIPVETGITQSHFTEILQPSISGNVIILGQEQLQDEATISLASKEDDSELPHDRGGE